MEQTTSDLGTAWRSVLDDLQPNQRAWMRASEPVTLHENTAIIAVPNDFTRTQLEGRLRGQLEDALTLAFGREIRIAVTVNPALDDSSPPTYEQMDSSTSREDDMSTIQSPVPEQLPRPPPSCRWTHPTVPGPTSSRPG